MNRKTLQIWIGISLAAWVVGYAGKEWLEGNEIFFGLFFFGWISSMLAIGFYSKPHHVVFGKIVYGFIILMIVGIMLKILHLMGGHELILIGLAGVVVTYAAMWFKNRRSPQ